MALGRPWRFGKRIQHALERFGYGRCLTGAGRARILRLVEMLFAWEKAVADAAFDAAMANLEAANERVIDAIAALGRPRRELQQPKRPWRTLARTSRGGAQWVMVSPRARNGSLNGRSAATPTVSQNGQLRTWRPRCRARWRWLGHRFEEHVYSCQGTLVMRSSRPRSRGCGKCAVKQRCQRRSRCHTTKPQVAPP